jgi:uncharacterized protein YjbI with pentapeptide repeats
MDAALTAKVWKRLGAGKALDGLGLPTVDGRFDLNGLSAPQPTVAREYQVSRAYAKELTGLVVLRGVTWRRMDFSKAKLDSLRFFDCGIDDCRFDGARCRDWRMWGTRISNTTFRSTDLRDTALGGIGEDGSRNSFHGVDFANADLRGTTFKSASMVGCTFANLSGVDFGGTVFVDCAFEGEIHDVLFYRHAFRGEDYPPNEMKGVDFSRATLRHVGFRGLDMDAVRWPADDQHIIVSDYPAALDRVLGALGKRSDELSRRLGVLVSHNRKWAGPNQREGIINKADWTQVGGEEMVSEFLRLARPPVQN